jgi:hypothetical protein
MPLTTPISKESALIIKIIFAVLIVTAEIQNEGYVQSAPPL